MKISTSILFCSLTLLISCKKDEPVDSNPHAFKQEFSVDENSLTGQFVGVVHAFDQNQNDTLMYMITSGNDSNAFSLDMVTGILTVNNPSILDYEKHPGFVLKISAINSSNLLLQDSAEIYIDIKNNGITMNGLVSFFPFANSLDDVISHKDATGALTSFFFDRRNWLKESLEFMGYKSYAVLDSIYDFPSRTVSFWFKALNINSKQILYNSDNSLLQNGLTSFYVNEIDTAHWLYYAAGDAKDSIEIYENCWYQACITVNNNAVTFYLNGQQFGQSTISSYLHSGCSTQYVTLGVDCSLTNYYYQGLIDDLLIYNRALNATEIRNQYLEYDLVQ